MSANARALALGVAANGTGASPGARRGVGADTAPRPARFPGAPPESGLDLRPGHDPKPALKASKGRIAKTVRPRARLGEASLRRSLADAPVAPS